MTSCLRISLLLAREDNPRLYDELAQFPKGQRRVNRLRTLAYDGLLAQRPAPTLRSTAPVDLNLNQDNEDIEARTERAQASLELFSEPFGG